MVLASVIYPLYRTQRLRKRNLRKGEDLILSAFDQRPCSNPMRKRHIFSHYDCRERYKHWSAAPIWQPGSRFLQSSAWQHPEVLPLINQTGRQLLQILANGIAYWVTSRILFSSTATTATALWYTTSRCPDTVCKLTSSFMTLIIFHCKSPACSRSSYYQLHH